VIAARGLVEQVIDRDRRARLVMEIRAAPLGAGALGLVRTRPEARPPRAAVLLIHGYAQNRHAWHLSRRSFQAYLAEAGYDVWAIDLRGAGRSRALGAPPARHFEDFVREDVPRALETIEAASGARTAFLVGHSLGAAVACSVAGRHPERVRGVVTLAGLYFFGRKNRFVRALGAAASALAAVSPVGLPEDLPLPTAHVGRLLALSRAAWDSPLSALLPLHAWAPGSIEPRIIVESVRRSFEPATLGVTLALAAMALGGRFCDRGGRCLLAPFEERRLPLFVACGEADSIIAPADARGAYDRSRSPDRSLACFQGFGHIDLIMGREAPRVVWPAVRRWLDER
jgi:pimeloyl-ACP methyl ester carboxylesterase